MLHAQDVINPCNYTANQKFSLQWHSETKHSCSSSSSSSSWRRRHGYDNDACLPAASHCIGFSLKRLACVSDPLPLPGHHYPQPRPITRPLNKGDYYSQQDMLHDTGSSLHISTHYTLWPVYHMKQNKTKQSRCL